ncbi:hypothetical protein VTN00DRAFT_626 [Thermoascus crustaceus]|uniref:uncharacterized protein n=1 Tax=Thermoascus crustaceus TaxID=5088 RepID=UPI003742274E
MDTTQVKPSHFCICIARAHTEHKSHPIPFRAGIISRDIHGHNKKQQCGLTNYGKEKKRTKQIRHRIAREGNAKNRKGRKKYWQDGCDQDDDKLYMTPMNFKRRANQ